MYGFTRAMASDTSDRQRSFRAANLLAHDPPPAPCSFDPSASFPLPYCCHPAPRRSDRAAPVILVLGDSLSAARIRIEQAAALLQKRLGSTDTASSMPVRGRSAAAPSSAVRWKASSRRRHHRSANDEACAGCPLPIRANFEADPPVARGQAASADRHAIRPTTVPPTPGHSTICTGPCETPLRWCRSFSMASRSTIPATTACTRTPLRAELLEQMAAARAPARAVKRPSGTAVYWLSTA
jgi:hypothetical protein